MTDTISNFKAPNSNLPAFYEKQDKAFKLKYPKLWQEKEDLLKISAPISNIPEPTKNEEEAFKLKYPLLWKARQDCKHDKILKSQKNQELTDQCLEDLLKVDEKSFKAQMKADFMKKKSIKSYVQALQTKTIKKKENRQEHKLDKPIYSSLRRKMKVMDDQLKVFLLRSQSLSQEMYKFRKIIESSKVNLSYETQFIKVMEDNNYTIIKPQQHRNHEVGVDEVPFTPQSGGDIEEVHFGKDDLVDIHLDKAGNYNVILPFDGILSVPDLSEKLKFRLDETRNVHIDWKDWYYRNHYFGDAHNYLEPGYTDIVDIPPWMDRGSHEITEILNSYTPITSVRDTALCTINQQIPQVEEVETTNSMTQRLELASRVGGYWTDGCRVNMNVDDGVFVMDDLLDQFANMRVQMGLLDTKVEMNLGEATIESIAMLTSGAKNSFMDAANVLISGLNKFNLDLPHKFDVRCDFPDIQKLECLVNDMSNMGSKIAKFLIGFLVGMIVNYIIHVLPVSNELKVILKGCFLIATLFLDKLSDVASKLMTGFVEFSKSFFSDTISVDEEAYVPQINDSVAKTGFITLLLTTIYTVMFSRMPNPDWISRIISTLPNLRRTKDGCVVIVDWLIDVFGTFTAHVCKYIGVKDPFGESSLFPEVDQAAEDVANLVKKFRSGVDYNYDLGMELFSLEMRINSLKSKIPQGRDYDGYHKQVLSLKAILQPFINKMERNNITGNGPRKEPYGILIGGPSGVGKSTATFALLSKIALRTMSVEKAKSFVRNHNDQFYCFAGENDFWDAYHGQHIVVVDELGSYRDSVGTPDPSCLAILRMINCMPYPLHMADLADKGVTNFHSDVVCGIGNRKKIEWKAMWVTEPFTRRFSTQLVAVPAKEFCIEGTVTDDVWDRRLDQSKVRPIEDDDVDTSVWEYFFHDYATGITHGKGMNFEDTVECIVNSYKQKSLKGDGLLKFQQKVILEEFKKNFPNEPIPDFCDKVVDEESKLLTIEEMQTLRLSRFYEVPLEAAKAVYEKSGVKDFWSNYCKLHFEAPCELGEKIYEAMFSSAKWVAIAGLISAGLCFTKLAWDYFKPQLQVQTSASSGDTRPKNIQVKHVAPRISKNFTQQMGVITENHTQMANKVVTFNQYIIEGPGLEGIYGTMTFVTGRVAIAPMHFYSKFKNITSDGSDLCLRFSRAMNRSSTWSVSFKDIMVYSADGAPEDFAFWRFPKCVPLHCDITNYFPLSNNALLKAPMFHGALMRMQPFGYSFESTTIINTDEKTYGLGDCTWTATKCLTYMIPTKSGDCGDLLFISDQRDKRPYIIGMHIAGNGSMGMSQPIYREFITEFLKQTNEKSIGDFDEFYFPGGLAKDPIVVEPNCIETDMIKTRISLETVGDKCFMNDEFGITLNQPFDIEMGAGDQFPIIREVKPPFLPSKTKIIKSPLYEVYGKSEFAPAVLRKDAFGDPWFNARYNYSREFGCFDMQKLNFVTNSYFHNVLKVSVYMGDPRVLTMTEAIEGIPGIMKGIPRNTSAGYPYCLETKLSGKKDFFGEDGPYQYVSDAWIKLKAEIDILLVKLRAGLRPSFSFIDFLKDERRKKSKVLQYITRLISASPITLLIVTRMYFGDFVNWMNNNRINNGIAVGVNPHSFEWTVIYNKLRQYGNDMIPADYKHYDGSEPPVLSYATLDFIENYYSNSISEEVLVRCILFEELVHSQHVVVESSPLLAYLVEWIGSVPSGHPLTTTVNSVNNQILVRYVGLDVVMQHRPEFSIVQAMKFFEDNSFSIVFGDDIVISVSERMKFITMRELSRVMREVGFTFTSDRKDGIEYDHRPIDECTFLKRGFKLISNGVVLAVLDIDIIDETLYWTKIGVGYDTFEEVVQRQIYEYSYHGEAVFNYKVPLLVNACMQKMKFRPLVTDFRLALQEARRLDVEF